MTAKKRTGRKTRAKKSKEPGISDSGDSAEDLFEELTEFERTKTRAEGDFIHKGVVIEVKKVTVDEKTLNGTINQVRALKNAVLVVYTANGDRWFVLDSKEVIRLVASLKKRGQHNENPLECCNLSVRNLEKAGHGRYNSKQLKRVVELAANRTRKDRANARFTTKMLNESKALAENHIATVKKRFKIK